MNRRKLLTYMTATGYSQKTLAAELGLSENSMSRKINGKRSFTLKEAVRICELLQIDSDEERARTFLREEGDRDNS